MVQTPATGVRLVGAVGVEAAPAAALRRSRDAGAPVDEASSTDAILASALAGAEMDVVADLVVTAPPAPLDGRRSLAAPSEPPRVEVDVAPGQSAVVLLEGEDGVFNWVFPDAPVDTRRARGGSGPETLTFTLAPADDVPADRRGLRSAIVDRLIEPVRVRIARFAAGQAIDLLVDRIEGDVVEGPIVMDGPALDWVATGPTLASPPPLAVTGRAPRVLLFVHGTFSTVRGSFGALEENARGQRFLEQARLRYDLVLGVDHRTLAVDPEANAALFERALAFLPDGTEVDAVGFSRGGLVLRSVVGRLGDRLKFGKLVFVGCTNAGTHLAEPDNWRTLVDLYTSILVAGGKLLGAATSPLVGAVTEQAVKLVAGFVKAMPQLGVEEGRVPGLAAMRPGSDTILRLARAEALGGAGPVHVVASNFEPNRGTGTGIAGKLAVFLGDRVVDRFFRDAANDLVVDTASMTDFGAAAEAPVFPLLQEMPVADAIYHVIYFATPAVADALLEWLVGGIRLGAAPPPPPAEKAMAASPPPAPPPAFVPTEPRRTRSAPPEAFPAVPFDGEAAATGGGFEAMPDFAGDAMEAPAANVEAAPPPAAVDLTPAPVTKAQAACFFAAEMDSAPIVARPVPLFVTISRDRVAVSGVNAAATSEPVAVSTSQPITVTVTGITNCGVTGEAVQKVAVPADSATLRFEIEGFAPGLARVQVEIHQDGLPLASLLLEPVFIAGTGEKVRAEVAAVPDRAAAGNAATLRIYELRQQDGSLLIRYDLSGKGLAEAWDKVLPASFSMETFVGQFLGKLDAAYRQSKTEYKLFLGRITDFAIDATNQLVPEDVRSALWEHRDKIDAIQVIADSPYMPWELLYIDDPAGGGQENRGFLAEWGLVRWMYNAVWPSDTLALRPDRVRYVIPDYLNVKDRLPQATQERDMLATLFDGKAAPVERFDGETQSESVNRFLSKNASDCDLLHFACHGEAQQMAVLNSDLVLSGEVTERGTIADDLLPCSAVKRRALFHAKGAEPSGMVFVNACQTGRAGEGISGVSGFADAFLRPVTEGGAAVFVGALWSVGDTLARTFADTFYARLLAGERLVDAVKAARKACQSESDFTWLAYTVYGNPFARAG
ncbi:MAG TPA: CHAT domain-containing protein [Novosphingobium sp.]|nr:CHAT domain-containing protein [Novosphingobium sp.]